MTRKRTRMSLSWSHEAVDEQKQCTMHSGLNIPIYILAVVVIDST